MHALQAVSLPDLHQVQNGRHQLDVVGVRAPEGYQHYPQFGQAKPGSVPLHLGRKIHTRLANNVPTPRQEV